MHVLSRSMFLVCFVFGSILSFSGCAEITEDTAPQPGTGAEPDPGPAPVGNGTASLTWTPPTERVDGSDLSSELAGYRIYYGTQSRQYSHFITVFEPGIATYLVDNLSPDTYYFAVTTLTLSGQESDYSDEATKVITGS